MLTHKASGQTQALLTLLTIDDEAELHRYRQTHPTEPNQQFLDATFLNDHPRKSGKENQVFRKQVLPKLNSSKDELKLLLRKLESNEINRKSEIVQERVLQPIRLSQNENCPKVQVLKSFREGKEGLKHNRKIGRANEPRSQLSFIDSRDGRAEQIQQLMRRNNYSANALNMKTLNILHEINTKNSRCSSGIKKKGRIPECVKPIKKNLVTFLRKVA